MDQCWGGGGGEGIDDVDDAVGDVGCEDLAGAADGLQNVRNGLEEADGGAMKGVGVS